MEENNKDFEAAVDEIEKMLSDSLGKNMIRAVAVRVQENQRAAFTYRNVDSDITVQYSHLVSPKYKFSFCHDEISKGLEFLSVRIVVNSDSLEDLKKKICEKMKSMEEIVNGKDGIMSNLTRIVLS
jgi:hypothetical protein